MTLATGTQLGAYEHINPVTHSAQNLSGSSSVIDAAKKSAVSGGHIDPVGL
jgi:hypothetical protein